MESDLKDYLQVIRKRLWLIVSLVLISTVTSGVVSFFVIQPVYEASTKLIVNKSNDQVGVNQLNSDLINTQIRLIETYKEIIKTPAIMDIVTKEHPEFNLTSDQLSSLVKVSTVNNTQVMTLSVQGKDQAKAANIANAISNTFKQEIPKIMKVDNVSILNEAKIEKQPEPVKPNKTLNIAIAFVVSLMVAVGLVFLLEYLDDTIKTEADVERILELPTLAAITKMKPEDLQAARSTQAKQIRGENHVTINS